MRIAHLVLPGLLLACGDDTNDEGPDGTECPDGIYIDADGDGYGDAATKNDCRIDPGEASRGGDCDDTDPFVNPGVPEDCTPIDWNCDGDPTADARDVIWYLDEDADGWGDENLVLTSCEQPPFYSRRSGDCAPNDPDVYPRTWYTDGDGDGFGDETQPSEELICEPPPGASTDPTDCDDADPTTYPGANDVCDGVDNDCDPSTDENDVSAWYPDLDGDGFGDETSPDVVLGCDEPPTGDYVQRGGDCTDADPDVNPDTYPDCTIEHSGPILDNEIWRVGLAHRVVGDVRVEGALNPTLTIEAGTTVIVDSGYEIRVGQQDLGRIVVAGTEMAPVTFTASAEVIQDADDFWQGIKIGDQDTGSSLSWFTIDYAGRGADGALELAKSDLAEIIDVQGATIRNSLSSGLLVTSGAPSITDSVFENNTFHGVEVREGDGLTRFEDNVLGDNAENVIVVPGSHVWAIDRTNDFSTITVPDLQRIEVVSGIQRVPGTWYDHGLAYLVRENDQVDVEDGPQARLTIEDGVVVEFGRSAGLRIGRTAEGTLTFEDGPNGVLFTLSADALPGDNWDGLVFGRFDGGSLVRNLVIEYGGFDGNGNISVLGSAPTITNITSRLSDTAGLYISGTGAAPRITDSSFLDNDEDGVYVAANSGIARDVVPTFTQNTITGNGGSSVVFPPNYVGELDPTTVFAGNARRVYIHGGTILEDAVWQKLDEDYQVLGDVNVGGPQDPVLEIEPAVTFYMDRNTRLGAGINDDGALIIGAGTDPASWVRLTSADAVPGPGDWEGLFLGSNGPFTQQSVVQGAFVEYAGGTGSGEGGAIEIRGAGCAGDPGALVDLSYVRISDSSRSSLYLRDRTFARVRNVQMTDSLEECVSIGGVCAQLAEYTDNDCLATPVFGEWPLTEADKLDDGNTFSGPIELVSGASLGPSALVPDVGQPYLLTSRVSVSAGAGPTLTIGANVDLQFTSDAGFDVAAGNPGSLVIQPGALLRPAALAPNWWGLRIGGDCQTVDIDGATIERAGGNGTAALWFNGCTTGTVTGTTFTNSLSCAIELGDESNVDVIDATFNGPGLCP